MIVPTLDRAPWLDRALRALAYQGHPAFEVIVVRGPCRDDTDAVLARHAKRIRVAGCAEANISAARNAGLELARGDAIAFLDDDATPEPDWLERLADGFADPSVGGVGGFIRDGGGVEFQCRTVVADRFGASKDCGGGEVQVDPPGPGVERYLSLTGANSAFRREALVEIGGFDETFAYFLDETDVCLRLVEAGWALAVAPQAEVHHAYAPSAQRGATGVPRRLFDCARSVAYFAVRHGAPKVGLPEAAERLQAYARQLALDTGWRADHGLIADDDADRMLGEIEAGVAQGAREALSGSHRRRNPKLPATTVPAGRIGSAPVLRASPDRLRLAHLCQDYPGAEDDARPPGGIAVWSRALAQVLAGRGHEVSVFAKSNAQASSVRFQAAGEGGLWLHRVGPPARAADRRASALALAPASVRDPALAQAAEVLRVHPRRRFDLAVGPLWGLQPAALLGRAPFPVAVSLHTTFAQLAAAERPDWDKAYRRDHVDKVVAAERRLLETTPHLLANSRTAVADLAERFALPGLADRATVVPHGLPDLCREVGPAAPSDGVEFLFVGRLERRKGIDTLLDAAPVVLAANPDVRLTLVGEETGEFGATPLAQAFCGRHAGALWLARVRFAGWLPHAELLERYAACDVVLAPSRYESFGLVAVEAAIFAKPCIAGDAGGLREVVAHGETGLRVAPGSPAALASAILELARAPQRRAAMGAAARRRYQALYTAEAMADAFEDWAWSVVDQGRRIRLAAE